MTRAYHHWTMGDIKLLRDHYPTGGVSACLRLWPHLSPNSIWKQASKQGIRFTGSTKSE